MPENLKLLVRRIKKIRIKRQLQKMDNQLQLNLKPQPLHQEQPLHRERPLRQEQPLRLEQPLRREQPLHLEQPLRQEQLLLQEQLLQQYLRLQLPLLRRFESKTTIKLMHLF